MLLSAIVFCPLLFAAIACALPKNFVRPVSLLMATFEFGLSLAILARFDQSSPALQLVERAAWIPELGITYFLGIDGLSLWLVLLTTFLGPIAILASWSSIEKKINGFHAALFALMTAMLGSFLAMDAVLFYVFFELSLVPMYFMVGIWGGPRRVYATLKFFIFTMIGSLLMLLAIIYLMFATRDMTGGEMSSSLLDLYRLKLPFVAGELVNPQTLLFFAFSIAFAIKVPMFPVHTWLPDAHVEAPTPGSVLLAAIMLKMGTYGFLRFVIPLFPEAAEYWSWLFLFLGVVGIVYGALVAMVQPDIKKLVAYSSVSHMGYVMIGLFALNRFGVSGALYQMLSHGVSTGALFILVGMIYERTHSREISGYGGLAKAMPLFAIFFLVVTLSSIAVPMTNGFIGEFLILLGVFAANKAVAMVAVTGVVLGAVYMLWMVKRVFFGEAGPLVSGSGHSSGHSSGQISGRSSGAASPLKDLSWREIATVAPLIVLIFWMGLVPGNFLDLTRSSVDFLVQNRDNYRLTIYGEPSAAALPPAPHSVSVGAPGAALRTEAQVTLKEVAQ
jgi:NADH-quinone oxidoreductase subunit M